MTSLQEIHGMLAASSADDWLRIDGWGIGSAPVAPALTNVEQLGEEGQVEGWHSRNYSNLLVFTPDVDLSIAYGLPAYYEGFERKSFDWADRHGWTITTQFADIRWRGQLVDRVTMWVAYKGVKVPVGDTLEGDGTGTRYVERWQYAISEAIAQQEGTGSLLDSTLRVTEQQVRP